MDIDGIKISELTRIDSVTDNDDFVVNSGGVTHKTRFGVIKGIIVQYVNGAIDAINQALVGEVSNRTQADNQLSGRIDNEVTARQSADSALGGRIDAEVSARGLADVELGSRISAESTARQSADSALGGRIDAEVSARQSADSALSSRVSSVESSLDDLENANILTKYNMVDLGDQTWTYESVSGASYSVFRCLLSDLPKSGSICRCTKYKYHNTLTTMPDKTIIISGTGAYTFIRIRDDSYNDATLFKSAVVGVPLLYQLATPTP